jgi:hypothetical protein
MHKGRISREGDKAFSFSSRLNGKKICDNLRVLNLRHLREKSFVLLSAPLRETHS